jgi:hypothetical protein
MLKILYTWDEVPLNVEALGFDRKSGIGYGAFVSTIFNQYN